MTNPIASKVGDCINATLDQVIVKVDACVVALEEPDWTEKDSVWALKDKPTVDIEAIIMSECGPLLTL